MANYLGGASSDLPRRVRVTPDGKMVSVIDIIMVVSFTHDDGRLKSSAQKNASDYNKILIRDHPEVSTLQTNFKFLGQDQRETPVAGRNGMLRIIQLLRGKKAATFRQSMADLLEKYMDADMGLKDDITDRALDAHMADLQATKAPKCLQLGGAQAHRVKGHHQGAWPSNQKRRRSYKILWLNEWWSQQGGDWHAHINVQGGRCRST